MDRDEGILSTPPAAAIDDAQDSPMTALPAGIPDTDPVAIESVCNEAPQIDAAPKLVLQPAPEPAAEPSPEQIIEALLMASDAPLSASKLAELAELPSQRDAERLIAALNEKYAAGGLSFRIEEIARGYQLLTQPAFHPWLVKLDKHRAQTRLSAAAMETLAIVAYKQPIIRADIEAIRGVASGEVLNRLREMGLVKIVGRAEIVGRPILYGTTKKFLDIFGLPDLENLPPMEALVLKRALPAAEPLAAPAETPEDSPRLAAAGA